MVNLHLFLQSRPWSSAQNCHLICYPHYRLLLCRVLCSGFSGQFVAPEIINTKPNHLSSRGSLPKETQGLQTTICPGAHRSNLYWVLNQWLCVHSALLSCMIPKIWFSSLGPAQATYFLTWVLPPSLTTNHMYNSFVKAVIEISISRWAGFNKSHKLIPFSLVLNCPTFCSRASHYHTESLIL